MTQVINRNQIKIGVYYRQTQKREAAESKTKTTKARAFQGTEKVQTLETPKCETL